MRAEQLQPVLERLLAARRARMEDTQGGAPRALRLMFSSDSQRNRLLIAQLFARELAVDLFELDLGRLVSQYVGETEKNIDAFFMAAEASNAVLLFDEADSLLGKRTDVKDAHDRYANLDVAYLLQRIEKYAGIVVLATNRGAQIDAAWLRDCEHVELSDD